MIHSINRSPVLCIADTISQCFVRERTCDGLRFVAIPSLPAHRGGNFVPLSVSRVSVSPAFRIFCCYPHFDGLFYRKGFCESSKVEKTLENNSMLLSEFVPFVPDNVLKMDTSTHCVIRFFFFFSLCSICMRLFTLHRQCATSQYRPTHDETAQIVLFWLSDPVDWLIETP